MDKKLAASAHTQPVYMEPHKDMPSTGVRIGTKGTVQCRKRLGFTVGRRKFVQYYDCLLYTSPSPRDLSTSRMPSSA